MQVEVVVLAIDKAKQEISLGMKQTEVNPWTLVKEKYPPGTVIEGTVQNLANYGAFIEIEEGIDGLLHVTDMSWTQKVGHPSEVLQKGQKVQCVVLSVDQDKKRVALGLKQLDEDPWERKIPEKYVAGAIVKGKVTKVTNFGVFVELEPGLEGLLARLGTGRPQGREPRGSRQAGPGTRSEGPAGGHRRAEDRPEPEARPVGGRGRAGPGAAGRRRRPRSRNVRPRAWAASSTSKTKRPRRPAGPVLFGTVLPAKRRPRRLRPRSRGRGAAGQGTRRIRRGRGREEG